MTDRSRIGRRSRRKGRSWEQQVVNRLKAAGLPAERGWWQAKGGARVSDVIVPGLWIECGTGRGPSADGARKLAQAVSYASGGELAVAITRRSGSRAIEVTMRLVDLITLVGSMDEDTRAEAREEMSEPVTVAIDAWLRWACAWYAHQTRARQPTLPGVA